MSSPVVIILAAGRGERFFASGAASHKLDMPLGGRTVIEHVIQAVTASGLDWYLVRPAGGTSGMGQSIAMGVKATADAAGWLMLPADLPLIQPNSLRLVAEGLRQKPVVVPYYRQRRGHPVGFSRRFLPSLMRLSGDLGAREIVSHARREGNVLALAMTDADIVQDIDTLPDFYRIQRRLQQQSAPR